MFPLIAAAAASVLTNEKVQQSLGNALGGAFGLGQPDLTQRVKDFQTYYAQGKIVAGKADDTSSWVFSIPWLNAHPDDPYNHNGAMPDYLARYQRWLNTGASAQVTGMQSQSLVSSVNGLNTPNGPQASTTGIGSVSGSYDIGIIPIVVVVGIFILAKRFKLV